KTENSPIREEEEKTRNTTHVTTVTDQAEKKNINNGSNNGNSIGNSIVNKAAARRPAPRPHSDWQGWKMA
ncbi:hypothetical protein, partial [Anaerovibrio sp.]|uniref:hypothetical protein n=1 Tax=Anaerovibrio sp. TaxID=1872532 RepID=UPI002634703D